LFFNETKVYLAQLKLNCKIMTYITEIIINLPRKDVINKLDNVDNIKHWQRGLISVEHLEGIPGKIGAKMKFKYKFGKREMELIETITKNNFPDYFDAIYNAKNIHNIQKHKFVELSMNSTKWISENEFQLSGFMMKLMAFLMPGSFKKQTLKYMQDFKAFAEHGTSVADAQN